MSANNPECNESYADWVKYFFSLQNLTNVAEMENFLSSAVKFLNLFIGNKINNEEQLNVFQALTVVIGQISDRLLGVLQSNSDIEELSFASVALCHIEGCLRQQLFNKVESFCQTSFYDNINFLLKKLKSLEDHCKRTVFKRDPVFEKCIGTPITSITEILSSLLEYTSHAPTNNELAAVISKNTCCEQVYLSKTLDKLIGFDISRFYNFKFILYDAFLVEQIHIFRMRRYESSVIPCTELLDKLKRQFPNPSVMPPLIAERTERHKIIFLSDMNCLQGHFIESTSPSENFFVKDMRKYCEVLIKFKAVYWARRNVKNNDFTYSLFDEVEMYIVWDFIARIANSWRHISESRYVAYLLEYMDGYDSLINSFNFNEFLPLENVFHQIIIIFCELKKIFSCLEVKPLLKVLPVNILLIISKVIHALSKHISPQMFRLTADDVAHMILPPMIITSIEDIKIEWQPQWRRLLCSYDSSEEVMMKYNDGECAVCFENMKINKFSLLECSHTVCGPCCENLIAHAKFKRFKCPWCQRRIRSIVVSTAIEKVRVKLVG